MSGAENWHRRPDAPESGPAVVFDLDGVISDATHRQRFLRQEPKDWRGFFEAGADDAVIESGRALVRSTEPGSAVVILTARPAYMREVTVIWLEANDVRYDILITRPEADSRSSVDYKRDEAEALEAAGFEVTLAIDDDMDIVEMYRQEGRFAMYIHSGYYERRDAERLA